MKIFLRALADIIIFVITLPIRILILIGSCILCVVNSIRFRDPFSEWFGCVLEGMQKGLKEEIHWIKTGKIEL